MKEEAGANAKARRITAKMKSEWGRELDEVGHLFCPMIGCFKKFVTVANFQTHYKWCTGKTDLQKCPYCESLVITAEKSFYQHMKAYHPEKVDEHQKEHPFYDPECDPSSSFVETDDNASLIMHVEEVTESPLKYHRKRKVSAKENNQTVWKHKMKSINDAAIKNIDQFQKCVRFNSIVDKIKSVDEVVQTIEELQEATTIKTHRASKKPKNIRPQNVIENELYFEDPDDSVDEPMVSSDIVQKTPKVGTKSVFVLDNEYYKRYHENLTMTRDWSSARKTYTRSRNSNSVGEPKFCSQMLNDSSQDEENINELSNSTGFQQVLESQHSNQSISDPSLSSEDRLQLTENLEPKDLIYLPDLKAVDYNLDIIATEEACIDMIINPDDAKTVNNYNEDNEDISKLGHQKVWSNPVRSLNFEETDFREDLFQVNSFLKKNAELRPIITYGERVLEEQDVTPRNTTVDFNNLLKNVKMENNCPRPVSKNKGAQTPLKSIDSSETNKVESSTKRTSLSYYRTQHSRGKHFNKSKLNVLTLFSCKAAKRKRLNRNNKFSKFYRQSNYAHAESPRVSYAKIKKTKRNVHESIQRKMFKKSKVKSKNTNAARTNSESNSEPSAPTKFKSFSEVSDFLYEQSAASYNKVISNVILDCETSMIDYQEMEELCLPENSENLNYVESTVISEIRDDGKESNSHPSILYEEAEIISPNENPLQNVANEISVCREIIQEVQNTETIDQNETERSETDFIQEDISCPRNEKALDRLDDSINAFEKTDSDPVSCPNIVDNSLDEKKTNEELENSIALDLPISEDGLSKTNITPEVILQQMNDTETVDLPISQGMESNADVSSKPVNNCDTEKFPLLSPEENNVIIEKGTNVSNTLETESLIDVPGTDALLNKKDITIIKDASDGSVSLNQLEVLSNDVPDSCSPNDACLKNPASAAKVADSEEIQISTNDSVPAISENRSDPCLDGSVSGDKNISLSTDRVNEVKHNETSKKSGKILSANDPQSQLRSSFIHSKNVTVEADVDTHEINDKHTPCSVSKYNESVIEETGETHSEEADKNVELSNAELRETDVSENSPVSLNCNSSLEKDTMNKETSKPQTEKESEKTRRGEVEKDINKESEDVENLNLSEIELKEKKITEHSLSAFVCNSSLAKNSINLKITIPPTDRKKDRSDEGMEEKDICHENKNVSGLNMSVSELNEMVSSSTSGSDIPLAKDNTNVLISTPQTVGRKDSDKKDEEEKKDVCKEDETVNNLNLSDVGIKENELTENSSSVFVCNSTIAGDSADAKFSTQQIVRKRGRPKKRASKAGVKNVGDFEALNKDTTDYEALNIVATDSEALNKISTDSEAINKTSTDSEALNKVSTDSEALNKVSTDSEDLNKVATNFEALSSRKSARIRSRKESMKKLDSISDALDTEKSDLVPNKKVLKSSENEVNNESIINQNQLTGKIESATVAENKKQGRRKSSSVVLTNTSTPKNNINVSTELESPNLGGSIQKSEKSFTPDLDPTTCLPIKTKKRGRPKKQNSSSNNGKTRSPLNSAAIDNQDSGSFLDSQVCNEPIVNEILNEPNSCFTAAPDAIVGENTYLLKKAAAQLNTPVRRGRPRKYPLKEPIPNNTTLDDSVPYDKNHKLDRDSLNISSKRRGRSSKKQKVDTDASFIDNTSASEISDSSLATKVLDPNFRKSPRKGQPKKCARYAYINSAIENCDQIIEDGDLEEKNVLPSRSGKRKGIKRKRESEIALEEVPAEVFKTEDPLISVASNLEREHVTLPLKQGRTKAGTTDSPMEMPLVDISQDLVEDDSSTTSLQDFLPPQEDNIFHWFKPKKCLWKALSESEQVQYYPPMIKSMPLRPIASQSDVELACFESLTLNDKRDFAFFTGAPIWSSAWCPTPLDKKAHQYVAVATSGSLANYYSFNASDDGKSLIQLWNLGFLQGFDLEQAPTLQLCLVFNYGNIFDMAWCPYGCWEDPDLNTDMPRLGLLAVASSDAYIRIYSIPHPNFTNSDVSNFPLYDVSPSAVLKPLSSAAGSVTEKSACMTLNWEKTGKCERIAAGYGNGIICVWLLNSSSTLLTGSSEENVFVPYLVFLSHSTPVTSVAFVPITKSRWLVSTGFEKEVKFWDLTDLSIPVATVKDGYACNVSWGAQSCGAFVTNHDSVSFRASHFCREYDLETSVTTYMDDCYVTSKKSAYSDQMNAVAVSDENGKIIAKHVHTNHSLYPNFTKKFPPRKIFAGKSEIPPLRPVDDKTSEPFTNYQELAVNTISWNPNYGSRYWLLAGGSSGVARLSCVNDLEIEDANS